MTKSRAQRKQLPINILLKITKVTFVEGNTSARNLFTNKRAGQISFDVAEEDVTILRGATVAKYGIQEGSVEQETNSDVGACAKE